jgi:hypothetical protein
MQWYAGSPHTPTPSPYELANYTIGTNLEKNKKYKKMDVTAQEKEDELSFGWASFSLRYKQVHYAALDARLGSRWLGVIGG